MKQGVLLVAPDLIAQPDIFDTLCDYFVIVRHLELNEHTHAIIAEHDQFMEIAEGNFLPCYTVDFVRLDGQLAVSNISEPFINQNIVLKCQRKKETNSNQVSREENQENLLWVPEP